MVKRLAALKEDILLFSLLFVVLTNYHNYYFVHTVLL